MRRLSPVLALALLGLLGAAPAVEAAKPSAFAGEWTAIDQGDGSTEHLYVSDGTSPRIVYTDEVATSACPPEGSLFFNARLLGSIDGDTLYGSFVVVKCGNKTNVTRPQVSGFLLTWTRQADGSLVDLFGDIWTRV